MNFNTDHLLNIELESGLNEMLDTCLGYVENVLMQETALDVNED